MSTAVRIISGSAAAWTRIGINMVTQVALVPLYLSYWNVETYGVWLAIQSLIVIMTMLDLGHHTYVGYELLRYAQKDMIIFCRYLWSALLIGAFVSAFEIILILAFMFSGLVPHLVGEAKSMDPFLVDAAGKVLLLQGISWVATSAFSGFFTRALEPFGYYARLSWWGVFHLIIGNTAPAIAIVFGANLLEAGMVTTVVSIVCYIPIYFDIFSLMRKTKIPFVRPSWSLGFRNFLQSAALTGKLILENARQQGVRLVLAPLSGAVGLAAFSTMRTGANVALQGLNTITNPLMPDLMRFLHGRDQVRSEAAFSTVWVMVVVLIAPGVVILQAVAEPIFTMWTHNRIIFDPLLFSMLSMSVLIYAVSQPAVAVVVGNNLMKPQLMLSTLSAVVVVAGIVALVPIIGIKGAGIALMVAELAASAAYIEYAKRWLSEMGLFWPVHSFWKAATSVIIAGVAMLFMVLFPTAQWLICGMALCAFGWNALAYWKILPDTVRLKARQIVQKSIAKVRKIS